MSVLPDDKYDELVARLTSFFAGVQNITKQMVDDAIALINDFIGSAVPPPSEDPIEEEPTSDPNDPTDGPPFDDIELEQFKQEFFADFTRADLKTGGSRTRNTAKGLITWEVPYKVTYHAVKNNYQEFRWLSQKWTQTNTAGYTTNAAVLLAVNQLKDSIDAQYVLNFTINHPTEHGIVHEYYFIKT